MAPIRRYLRISKYSVLECRIYLENPSDVRWLLNPHDGNNSVLHRIFNTIRPLVLPKLREENERVLAKKKSNPVKDVLAGDDFEVTIFLRESGTRHSILTKQKAFGKQGTIKSNSNKLTGTVDHTEILVESDDDSNEATQTRISLSDIPQTNADENRTGKNNAMGESQNDDKKPNFIATYDGFSIWGWVLCLLVTRKGRNKTRTPTASGNNTVAPVVTSGQALMEEWIGTQNQPVLDED